MSKPLQRYATCVTHTHTHTHTQTHAQTHAHTHTHTHTDMDFNISILSDILNNGNIYESRVLKEYMESKSLSIKDVLSACCAKLEAEEYVCSVSSMSPTTRTCYKCALRSFRELVYLFRKDIPTTDLPGEMETALMSDPSGEFPLQTDS